MAIKKEIEINADTGSAIKEIKELFKTMVDAEKQAQKQTETLNENVKEVGETAKKTEKGVNSISKGFKGLGLAIKAAGIGLVISALTTLKDVFTQNQKVAYLFSTAFETISIVFNEFVGVIVDVYENISKTSENFDALGKVLTGILNIALAPLKFAFYGIKLGVQELQLAWEDSFLGDKDPETIKRLNKEIELTKQNLIDVKDGVVDSAISIKDNFGEAIDEFGNITNQVIDGVSKISIKGAYESAKANVQLKNTAEIAAAEQSRLVEQYDRQAEKLRQIRDNDLLSLNERKKANEDLNKTLDEQEKAMLKQADLQIASAQAEANKNNSIENRKALIEALSNKEGVLAQIEGFRSEQQSNKIALEKEEIDLINSRSEAENQLAIEQKRFLAEQETDEVLRLEMLKSVLEQEKLIELERLQNKINSYALDTQARLDAETEYNSKKQEIDQAFLQNELELSEAKKKIAEQERQLENQKIKDKQMVVDAISQFADAETGIGKALLIVKQGLALQETLMDLKRITFKGAEAIGTAGISTAQNVAESSKIGFPQNIITIASAIAQGIGIMKSVKSAVSKTKAKVSGVSSSVPSVPSGGGATASLPPAFNIVGSDSTNQLADAISGQEKQPIKAYVTTNDVTTGQALERNIVQGASIG